MEASVPRFENSDQKVARKVVETPQRRRLGDVEVISHENPRSTSACQEVSKVCDYHAGAAVEQEGDGDVAGR